MSGIQWYTYLCINTSISHGVHAQSDCVCKQNHAYFVTHYVAAVHSVIICRCILKFAAILLHIIEISHSISTHCRLQHASWRIKSKGREMRMVCHSSLLAGCGCAQSTSGAHMVLRKIQPKTSLLTICVGWGVELGTGYWVCLCIVCVCVRVIFAWLLSLSMLLP